MDRRQILIAAAGAVPALSLASAVTAGPLEQLFREWLRRDNLLNAKVRETGDDSTDAEIEWLDEPLVAAADVQPTTCREWAALVLISGWRGERSARWSVAQRRAWALLEGEAA